MSTELKITVDEVRASGILLVLEKHSEVPCEKLRRNLEEAASKDQKERGTSSEAVFRLIQDICSYHLSNRDGKEPYQPMMVFENRRSAIPEDIGESTLDTLAEIVDQIKAPDLRARIADIIWLRRRDYGQGKAALEGLLEYSQIATSRGEFPVVRSRLKRAAGLARILDKDGNLSIRVGSALEDAINVSMASDGQPMARTLIGTAFDLKIEDKSFLLARLDELAEIAEGKRDWIGKAEIHQLSARASERHGDTINKNQHLVRAGESYVEASKQSLSGQTPSYINATHWIEAAIKTLRGAPGTKDRREELRLELRQLQPQIRNEMGSIEHPVDLGDSAGRARDAVRGKDLVNAMVSFALLANWPDVDELEKEVQKGVDSTPLVYTIGATIHDSEGKVVHRYPPMNFDNVSRTDPAVSYHMSRHHNLYQQLSAAGAIEPARKQIQLEHKLEIDPFLSLCRESAFVAPESEGLVAKGMLYGFDGLYVEALCILIPQLENCFRYLLKTHGTDVSKISQNQTQQDLNMNELLFDRGQQLSALIGEGAVFDCRSIFVEPGGPNLRNSVAHGLDGFRPFSSGYSIYAFWLIFRLCLQPVLVEGGAREEE